MKEVITLTTEDLIKYSPKFDDAYGVRQNNVDKANKLAAIITATRDNNKPMPGDIIIISGPTKTYHGGHIENYNRSNISVRIQPYIPFTRINPHNKKEILFDTSGGYWFGIALKELLNIHYVGIKNKLFRAWGHRGPCADGAFTYQCEVNVWKYFSPEIY